MNTKNVIKNDNEGSIDIYVDGKKIEHMISYKIEEDFTDKKTPPKVTIEMYANFDK